MKKNAAVFPILLVLVVVAFAAWTMLRGNDPADASATFDGAPDVDGAPLSATPATQPEPGRRPIVRTVPPDDPSSLFAAPRNPAEEQAERDRILAQLEQQHNAQPIDPAWAGPAEAALEKLTEDPGLVASQIKPDAYRSECRTSSCRISADFSSHADAEDWSTMYITNTGRTFQRTRSMVIPTGDGGYEARIYGTRR
jgi:hypothetical protein